MLPVLWVITLLGLMGMNFAGDWQVFRASYCGTRVELAECIELTRSLDAANMKILRMTDPAMIQLALESIV